MAEEAYDKYKDPALATESAYAPVTAETNAELTSTGERIDVRNETAEGENRAKLIASGELTEDAPEFLAQEAVNNSTYGVPNPKFASTSPAVSSSDAADEVDGQNATAQSELANTTALLGLTGDDLPQYKQYQDFASEIEASRGANKTMYEQMVDTIKADFDNRMVDQTNENRITTGFHSVQLARMKGFGTSVSGMSFLKQVEVQNQTEMNKLLVQKSQALIAAQMAYQAQDWTMLTRKIDESKAITDKYNDIQQWMLEDKLKTNDQLMEQARFGWDFEDRAMGKMDSVISSGIAYDDVAAADIAKWEKQAGVTSGYFKALYDSNAKAKAVEDATNEVELQTAITDLRAKTPEGMKFRIGDTWYEGWDKEDKDTWETTETDINGNVTFVSYDRQTGELSKINLGPIGKITDGWTVEQVDGAYFRVNSQTGVAEPIVLAGGEVDPSYLAGFDQWAQSIGTVTTPFGGSTGFEGSHPGWDIAAPVGTPVTPFVAGTVTGVDTVGAGGSGKWVEVTDSEGRRHRYHHLNSVDVTMGQTVSTGSKIGGVGNTGNVMTTQGTGEAHVPTDEERAGGAGAHLDYRVYIDDSQLVESTTTGPVDGMASEEVSAVSADMTSLMSETDPSIKKSNYYAIRNQIAAYGTDAISWFDKAYPATNYGISADEMALPTIGQIEDDKLGEYSADDIESIIARDTVTWDQLSSRFGTFSSFTANDVIDMAYASGATMDQVHDILAKGGLGPFGDRWTSGVEDYAKEVYKDGPKAVSTTSGAKTNTSAKAVVTSGSPLEVAESYLGLNAGNPEHAKTLSAFFKKAGGLDVDPATTAWCAAFLNSVLGASGIKGTGSLLAQSFLKFGTTVSKPTKGDIVVFERGPRGGWQGHVGIIAGVNENGTLQVLGGNQSGSTSIQTFKTDRVLGYRRINNPTG
jgi:uncharacterized protein (TIGR02594 family)